MKTRTPTPTDILIDRMLAYFNAPNSLSWRAFGAEVMGDPNFVYDVFAGRRTPRKKTIQMVERVLETKGF